MSWEIVFAKQALKDAKKLAACGLSASPGTGRIVAIFSGHHSPQKGWLGTLDPATGKFTPKGPAEKWDVDTFDIAEDGSFIAYVVNEAGMSKLRLLDPKSGAVRTVDLPAGVIGGVSIAPWGEVGFSFTSARSAA